MHPSIVIGNIVKPQRLDCSQLPAPSRIIGLRTSDVSLIPVVWDEKTDPPAPFVMDLKELAAELRLQISTAAAASHVSYQRERPTKRADEDSVKLRAAFAPLIDDEEKLERALFDARYRAQCLAEISSMSEATTRRYLHRYLALNFEDNVFLRYTRKDESKNRRQSSGAKRGCSKGGPALHLVRPQLEAGIQKYYTKKKHTAKRAYAETLLEHYPKGCDERVGKDGKTFLFKRPDHLHALPTESQFRYLIALLNETQGLSRRRHQTPSGKSDGPVHGSARDYVDLPGKVFQADATKLQIRTVASWDRSKIIQDVTLYVAVDVAVPVVTGWIVSPDAPSTNLALRLLRQCGSDKQKEIEDMGLEFCAAEWTAEIPSNLHADRGEWVSVKAESITRAGISIKVGEPYRPRKKGSVEQTHNLIKQRVKRELLPGLHQKRIERGETDGLDDAAFTIQEIRIVIAEIILAINRSSAPDDAIPPEMYQAGERDFSRINVWKWRTENEPGAFRRLGARQLFEATLMSRQGSITTSGILYEKRTYRSDTLHELGLTAKAARKREKVKILIDESLPAYVYFLNPKTKKLESAHCRDADLERLKLDYWEAEQYSKDLNAAKRATDLSASMHDAKAAKRRERLTKDAKAATHEAVRAAGVSKNARKKGRRAASAVEKVTDQLQHEKALRDQGLVPPIPPAAPTAPPAAEVVPTPSPNPAATASIPLRSPASNNRDFRFIRRTLS